MSSSNFFSFFLIWNCWFFFSRLLSYLFLNIFIPFSLILSSFKAFWSWMPHVLSNLAKVWAFLKFFSFLLFMIFWFSHLSIHCFFFLLSSFFKCASSSSSCKNLNRILFKNHFFSFMKIFHFLEILFNKNFLFGFYTKWLVIFY